MIDLLKMLAGEWAGSGAGEYPTINSFEYLETLRFTLDEMRPILHYQQKTHRRDIGQQEYRPSHWETGFIYQISEGEIEWANVQTGGRLEVMRSTIEPAPAGFVLELKSSLLANDPQMLETTRRLAVNGDTLHYTMHMATKEVPGLAIHLEATLQRESHRKASRRQG